MNNSIDCKYIFPLFKEKKKWIFFKISAKVVELSFSFASVSWKRLLST